MQLGTDTFTRVEGASSSVNIDQREQQQQTETMNSRRQVQDDTEANLAELLSRYFRRTVPQNHQALIDSLCVLLFLLKVAKDIYKTNKQITAYLRRHNKTRPIGERRSIPPLPSAPPSFAWILQQLISNSITVLPVMVMALVSVGMTYALQRRHMMHLLPQMLDALRTEITEQQNRASNGHDVPVVSCTNDPTVIGADGINSTDENGDSNEDEDEQQQQQQEEEENENRALQIIGQQLYEIYCLLERNEKNKNSKRNPKKRKRSQRSKGPSPDVKHADNNHRRKRRQYPRHHKHCKCPPITVLSGIEISIPHQCSPISTAAQTHPFHHCTNHHESDSESIASSTSSVSLPRGLRDIN